MTVIKGRGICNTIESTSLKLHEKIVLTAGFRETSYFKKRPRPKKVPEKMIHTKSVKDSFSLGVELIKQIDIGLYECEFEYFLPFEDAQEMLFKYLKEYKSIWILRTFVEGAYIYDVEDVRIEEREEIDPDWWKAYKKAGW